MQKICDCCGAPLEPGQRLRCKSCAASIADDAALVFEDRPKPEYNHEERGAQADALGITYGRLIFLMENHLPLPPQIKPIKWPRGSRHSAETTVLVGNMLPTVRPKPKPMPPDYLPEYNTRYQGRCSECGEVKSKQDLIMISAKLPGTRAHRKIGFLCERCFPGWRDEFQADGKE